MTAHVISQNSVKGGVTKTTTSINLAVGLARKGKRTLLLDMDPQSNATYSILGKLSEAQDGTLYVVIIEEEPIKSVIVPTKVENLHIAPGTIALSAADLQLASVPGREWILHRALEEILEQYDYIIIDTPPNLNLLSVNCLTACSRPRGSQDKPHSGFILPIGLTLYAMLGIKLLENTLRDLSKNLRIEIPMIGVVAALKDNTIESRERLKNVKERFKDEVFSSVIPRNVVVDEANDKQILYDYAPQSAGALAYIALVEEVISRVG